MPWKSICDVYILHSTFGHIPPPQPGASWGCGSDLAAIRCQPSWQSCGGAAAGRTPPGCASLRSPWFVAGLRLGHSKDCCFKSVLFHYPVCADWFACKFVLPSGIQAWSWCFHRRVRILGWAGGHFLAEYPQSKSLYRFSNHRLFARISEVSDIML